MLLCSISSFYVYNYSCSQKYLVWSFRQPSKEEVQRNGGVQDSGVFGVPDFLTFLHASLSLFVARRVNKGFQELSSLLSYGSCASAQGSAVPLSKLLPADMFCSTDVHSWLCWGTAKIRGHVNR